MNDEQPCFIDELDDDAPMPPWVCTRSPRITPEESARRKAAIDQARASSRLEGVILPPQVEELNQRFIAGQISSEEHVQAVLARADALYPKAPQ